MKLLASDYDGTLNTEIKDLKINIEYIKKFRQKGHKFMITTGRNYYSIKRQIEMFNIPYDYLSCNDGAVLFDNKDNLLFADYLNTIDVRELLEKIYRFDIASKLELYGTYDRTDSLNGVTEIYLKTKYFKNRKLLLDILNEYDLKANSFFNYYYIEKIGGKSRSIKALNEKEKFDEIITVGDNKNDIEMLIDYDGYKMLASTPSLYLSHLKSTSSVKSLIKKLI